VAEQKRYRYPGTKPFETDQQAVFYGREEVSRQLYQLVTLEPLVVMHAKSGLGKSSLINAGLLPIVAKEQEFVPNEIRFYAAYEGKEKLPLQITRERVESRSAVLDKIRPEGDGSLWYHLKARQLELGSDRGILLVFDQFEELFSYPDAEIEAFARQLSEALYSSLPQRYSERRRAGFAADPDFLSQEELALLNEPIQLRLLFSIRSDRMSLLKQLKAFFPTILVADFELEPLSREQAEDAILSPAYQKAAFVTPVFDYDDDAVEYLLDFLSEGGENPIESFQLQILCEFVERRIVEDQKRTIIVKSDIFDPGEVLTGHYLEKIGTLPTVDQLTARRLLEDKMIFVADKRRLTLYEGQITQEYGVSSTLLAQLLDTHLIRSEPSLRGGYTYELSHDTLVEPVLKARAVRIASEEQEAAAEAARQRKAEIAELKRKEEEAQAQVQKEFELRAKAEAGEKQARNRTRLAGVATLVALVLFGIAVWFYIDAREQFHTAQLARQRAEVAQNASLALRINELDPTMALRIADYNWWNYPEQEDASIVYSKLISQLSTPHYQKSFRGHEGSVSTVTFSPDGQRILTGSGDGTAKHWNSDGQLLQTFAGHGAYVYSVAFSPDGQRILTGGEDETAKLWNSDGQLLQTFAGHGAYVYSVTFSPDGQRILTGGGDNTAKLWNSDGQLLQTLAGHEDSVWSVTFSPDGQRILTGSRDGTAKLWNSDGQLLQTFAGHGFYVYSVAFSPDGQRILTGGGDNTAKLWNSGGQLLQTFAGHEGVVSSIAFSPGGQRILTGSWDGTAKLWNTDGQLLQTFTGHGFYVYSVAFSPDGQRILTGSKDGTAKLWYTDGQLLQTFAGHESHVSSIAISPDGKWILTGSGDGSSKLWDTDGQLLHTFAGYKGLFGSVVAFSPDGRQILTGGEDGTVKLWNIDGQLLQEFAGHGFYIHFVTFSPDGQRIFTGSGDGTAMQWNSDGQLLHTFSGHEGMVSSMAISTDGQRILTGSEDGTVKLWNSDGQLLQTFAGHEEPVHSVAFSPDGRRILTGGEDETAKLWNSDGQLLQTFAGHEESVRSVTFSPDGQRILTGGEDETAKLWNSDGQLLQTFAEHGFYVYSVTFSPDGQRILTGGGDRTAKLWLTPQAYLDSRVYKFSLQELYDAGVALTAEDRKKVKLREDDQ
jgi:WD40 repeat protein